MQTGEGWNTGVVPKAIGGQNLDEASRSLTMLEHFVMFSSIVASAGNEGEQLISKAEAFLQIMLSMRQTSGKLRPYLCMGCKI